MLFDETARVSSGFPGCTRDDGTAMNSVFNSITSVVLVMSIMLNVINSINNNNNNNDNNNNNNDNNNVSIRCLMVSTDQADPSCFYFRIS